MVNEYIYQVFLKYSIRTRAEFDVITEFIDILDQRSIVAWPFYGTYLLKKLQQVFALLDESFVSENTFTVSDVKYYVSIEEYRRIVEFYGIEPPLQDDFTSLLTESSNRYAMEIERILYGLPNCYKDRDAAFKDSRVVILCLTKSDDVKAVQLNASIADKVLIAVLLEQDIDLAELGKRAKKFVVIDVYRNGTDGGFCGYELNKMLSEIEAALGFKYPVGHR
jgi:hypothetical protein